MSEMNELEEELHRIDGLIDEAEKRLGAHSIKPVLMQEFLDLEEERERLLEKIRQLRVSTIGKIS